MEQHQYLGALIAESARCALVNERLVCCFTDIAAHTRLPFQDPQVFLAQVQFVVQCEFGPQFEVSFFDVMAVEVMDVIDLYTPFHLIVSLRDSIFFSKAVH